ETASRRVAADRSLFPARQSRVECLRDRFHQIRNFTNSLCAGLEPEDCVVQSMPDVSPTKWHLAHTTWFFETFILKRFASGYRAEIPEYAYLFNSYYNAAGDMHRRDLRGLISRPTVSQAQRYRASVDSHIDDLLSNPDESLLDEMEPILVLGIHHEQQHQELLITDIKHVLAQIPPVHVACGVIIRIEKVSILRDFCAISRGESFQDKGFEKPGGMRKVPFGRTDIRHRLHDAIFGFETSTQRIREISDLMKAIAQA